jgi:hypothetical protein
MQETPKLWIIPVELTGPRGSRIVHAVLDTGACHIDATYKNYSYVCLWVCNFHRVFGDYFYCHSWHHRGLG